MNFKVRRRIHVRPVATAVLILGCAAYAITAVALHRPTPAGHQAAVTPKATATGSPTATITPTPAPTPAPPLGPVWADEFTGPAGGAPSPAKWNHDIGGSGWGNDEWQYYTGSTQNAALDGAGNLIITARRPEHPAGSCAFGPCDITSARLQTDGIFSTTYGRVEARIKTPAGRGLWPAFWMIAQDDRGEIDIMENNGRDPSVVSGTLHVYHHTPPQGLTREFTLPRAASAAAAFHVYAVDWSPQQISWSVDGQVYQVVKKTDPAARPWVFDQPHYLVLNLAVGSEDPGYPDSTTPFPARLIVDYVRVYK